MNKFLRAFIFLFVFSAITCKLFAQSTQIRGFIDGTTTYQKGQVSFGFEEQDLFITSQITDRISFLGESVFKFTDGSPTDWSVSVERVIFKYNYSGNNSVLFGKHHTPINYWNESYHHGRVFYPTIYRPLLFDALIIPLHTTGIDFQGEDLGDIRFGYDFMIGNGLGSMDVEDNDKAKSFTTSLHIEPVDKLRIGASWYNDNISKGATPHGFTMPVAHQVSQNLVTGSVAYFGKKYELLAESTLAFNHTDTTGTKRTSASYIYGGIRLTDKWVPYGKVEKITYQQGEQYYTKNNTMSYIAGIRYEISYLAVIKLEYEHDDRDIQGHINKVTAQFAIGF